MGKQPTNQSHMYTETSLHPWIYHSSLFENFCNAYHKWDRTLMCNSMVLSFFLRSLLISTIEFGGGRVRPQNVQGFNWVCTITFVKKHFERNRTLQALQVWPWSFIWQQTSPGIPKNKNLTECFFTYRFSYSGNWNI